MTREHTIEDTVAELEALSRADDEARESRRNLRRKAVSLYHSDPDIHTRVDEVVSILVDDLSMSEQANPLSFVRMQGIQEGLALAAYLDRHPLQSEPPY